MGKHEAPPFKMLIEGGKLVPATAYDAERLDTYRRGTKVSVRFTEEKDRVMVRKWFAILGLVVKQCDVPWKNKDEASEAIKLALGIVNLTKTVGGDFMQYPKSLTELTDPEVDEAVRDMMDLIHRMTGIDPETLRKEAADVGADDETESSEASPEADDAGSAVAAPDGTSDLSAAREVEPGAGRPEAEATAPAAEPASGDVDEREWLKSAAKMLIAAAEPGGDPEVVRNQYAGILKGMTPKGISEAAIAKASSIGKRLVAVCEQTEELDLDLIAGLAGCDAKDLR